MNPKVDALLEQAEKWQAEFKLLRKLVLKTGMTEEVKWGQPCYLHNHNNVVIIHGFKEYCALLFFKGALMADTDGLLVRQSENVQSARQMRFTTSKEIQSQKAAITAYLYEAMEIENAGLKVKKKETAEYEVPEEFSKELKKNASLRKAFEALSPGRQRGYLLYFGQAKQAKTRIERIEKHKASILAGKGLND